MQNHQAASKTIKQQLEKLSKIKPSPSEPDLKQLQKQLLKYGLPYAIFLIGSQFLFDIIKIQNKVKISLFAICENFCSNIFRLRPEKFQRALLEQMQKSAQYKDTKQVAEVKGYQPTDKEEKINNFLQAVIAVIREQGKEQKYLKIAIDEAFKIKCLQADSKTIIFNAFQEYSINYINSCLEQVRKKVQPKNICCKTIYKQKQQIESAEGPSQQFKRYVWPINNVSIKNHLTKTIIGFMNSKGGIIFIGVMETKQKKNEIAGIQLKPIEVKQIKDLINELVGSIHPKHEGFQTQTHSKDQDKNLPPVPNTSHSNFDYKINDYVRMEFMRVVDANLYTNVEIRSDNKEHIGSLYIVKIIVKIGHPKHLYHITNAQKNIDFFQRKDRNVQKMQFPDAYNEIYSRLDKFELFKTQYLKQGSKQSNRQRKSVRELKRELFHPNCRQEMNDIIYMLEEDRKAEGEDDDSDD